MLPTSTRPKNKSTDGRREQTVEGRGQRDVQVDAGQLVELEIPHEPTSYIDTCDDWLASSRDRLEDNEQVTVWSCFRLGSIPEIMVCRRACSGSNSSNES